MNITPIGEEYPIKEEEKYDTPSGNSEKKDPNQMQNLTPSPPPFNGNEQEIIQDFDKKKDKKDKKQTKKIKKKEEESRFIKKF